MDALLVPGWDAQDRAEHLRLLGVRARDPALPDALATLLDRLHEAIRLQSTGAPSFNDGARSHREVAIADLLGAESWRLPRYAFHGTIYGRLASICEHGLRPAFRPVWREPDLAARCRDSVFLADTWRGAAAWAHHAHLRSRGRRDGLHRTPVVIRVPVVGLELEVDRLAMAPGNLLVRDIVSVAGGSVLVGPRLSGFPKWQPLSAHAAGAGAARRGRSAR